MVWPLHSFSKILPANIKQPLTRFHLLSAESRLLPLEEGQVLGHDIPGGPTKRLQLLHAIVYHFKTWPLKHDVASVVPTKMFSNVFRLSPSS